MSGLMEILELLNSYNTTYNDFQGAIVPTVLLPLAFLSTGISIVATYVAGLFGVKLKAEGPKKLLELLLRPKLLISAICLNIVIYFGVSQYQVFKNGPMPKLAQSFMNRNIEHVVAPLKSDLGLNWHQNITEGIFATGAIVEDELFVGSKDGNLYVLNAKTGAIKNKIFFGKFLSPTPVFYKGFLYFGEGLHASHHMGVYKFNPKTKEIVARFETTGHTEILPVITQIDGKDYLFQTAGDDGIYALDPDTMEVIWHYVDGHMDAFALVDGDSVYVASGVPKEDIGVKRPYAYKLNVKTGELDWKRELPLSSWYGPLKVRDSICFIQGELHVKSNIGGINCLGQSGQRMKNIILESPIIGKPLVIDNNVIFNSFNGNIYSWDYDNNSISWSIEGQSASHSYSSIKKLSNNSLIYVNSKGHVRNLDQSGKILNDFSFNEKEAVYADPLVLQDGYILFGMGGSVKYYLEN